MTTFNIADYQVEAATHENDPDWVHVVCTHCPWHHRHITLLCGTNDLKTITEAALIHHDETHRDPHLMGDDQ